MEPKIVMLAGTIMFVAGLSLAGWAIAAGAGARKGEIIGIGGVFLKAKDPANLGAWYRDHLGIDAGKYGKVFSYPCPDNPKEKCQTAWSLFPENTTYFGRADQQVMINYLVRDLDGLLAQLKEQGIEPVKPPESADYGKFAWIEDGEGNRVELWEPKN